MFANIAPRFFTLLACAFLCAATLGGAATANPNIGTIAPSFKMTLYDKSTLQSEQLKGKVIIINYWATWCGPCKAEMPMMSNFYRQHKSKGLAMFGVVARDSVPMSKLKAVDDALSYPLVRKFSGKYGTIDNAVPTTYIIDRSGKIRVAETGAFSKAEFEAAVLPLLAEKAPKK